MTLFLAATMQIVGFSAEFSMKIDHTKRFGSFYSNSIVPWVLVPKFFFESQILGNCSEGVCSLVFAVYTDL